LRVWTAFLPQAFFSLQRLKAFFSFEEDGLFHGIGADRRGIQMGMLAFTDVCHHLSAQGISPILFKRFFFIIKFINGN
jgi:hypothetical protein